MDKNSDRIPRPPVAVLLILLAAGLAGVASLALIPLETLLPPEANVPRVALLIQPAILVSLFAVAGWFAAPKVGLDAPVLRALVSGADWRSSVSNAIVPALIGAAATAAILVGYASLDAIAPLSAQVDLPQPLAAKLLYGGVSEEIIARWGILSLLMLLAIKLGLPRGAAFWPGNAIAAALFALGHFTLLFALIPDPSTALIAAVAIGNFVPGLIFGWLFARRGLEAAILAHAGAHLLSTIAMAAM